MLTTLKDQFCRWTCRFQLSKISSLVTLLSYIICGLLCLQTWMLSHADSLQRQIVPIPFLSVDDSLEICPRAWCNSLLRLHAYTSGQLKYSCNTMREVEQTNKQEVSWPDDLNRKRWKSTRRSAPDQLRSRPDSILQRFHRSWTVQSHESFEVLIYLFFLRYHISKSFQLLYLWYNTVARWKAARAPDSGKACVEITNNLWSSMHVYEYGASALAQSS